MTSFDKIFTEEQVEKMATSYVDKVIVGLKTKINDIVFEDIYRDLKDYIYQHYTNSKDSIEEELIGQITEQYVKNPSEYKFKNLRRKIWDENKDEIIKTLTDEAIKESVENVIQEYTHRNYHFNWQWKDGIVKIILKNWDSFRNDERIKDGFGRELERKQAEIDFLTRQLQEARETLN